jgi:hypothetical protein
VTYATFLRQYEASPPEKLDGYFPFHFDGMSEAERARARAMLLDRALDGDTIDLDGLRLVGDADTVSRLKAAEGLDATYGPQFDVVRRETLFALTQDYRELAGILPWIDSGELEVRRFAAEALSRHALPTALAPAITERLADGRHEEVVIPLVKAWLSTQGEPVLDLATFQQRLPLIRSIVSAQPAMRPELMEKRHRQ